MRQALHWGHTGVKVVSEGEVWPGAWWRVTGLDEACTSWGFLLTLGTMGWKYQKRPPSCFPQPCISKGRLFPLSQACLLPRDLNMSQTLLCHIQCRSIAFLTFLDIVLHFSIHSLFLITSFWYNFKCRHRKAVETVQGTLLYPLSRFNHCWYFALSVYFYMHIPPPPPSLVSWRHLLKMLGL